MKELSLFSFVDLTNVRSDDAKVLKYRKMLLDEMDPRFTPYKHIQPGIRKFIRDRFDVTVIRQTLENVLSWNPDSPKSRSEKENSILALMFILSMDYPNCQGIQFEKCPSFVYSLAGLKISMAYDVVLSYWDQNNKRHVGAIKLKLKKNGFSFEEAEMATSLLAKSLEQHYPDAFVEPGMCYCFNPFQRRFYSAVNIEQNYVRALSVAKLLMGTDEIAA